MQIISSMKDYIEKSTFSKLTIAVIAAIKDWKDAVPPRR